MSLPCWQHLFCAREGRFSVAAMETETDMLTTHSWYYCCRDSTAAACAKAVRVQLKELEAQQAVLEEELKAEQAVQDILSTLRYAFVV